MSVSAIRERRRRETTQRITQCAQRLTEECGLDGFTMDDLARSADVSRRTLFNYFPSKLDAVLGAALQIDPDDLLTFSTGGPTGNLLEDLGVLAEALLDVEDFDRESVELGRRVLLTSPRLLLAAHERFEAVTAEFATLILAREGEDFGASRARLLVRILVTAFDASLDAFLADPLQRPIADSFHETLRVARDLLA